MTLDAANDLKPISICVFVFRGFTASVDADLTVLQQLDFVNS